VRESRLVQEIAAWDDVVDQLREGVVVIDRAGLVVAANEAAARFLGTPREELTGSLARTQVVVVDEEGRPMPQERLPSTRAFRTGVPQHEPVQYRRRDGSSVWLLARAVPLWEPGQPAPGRVAIFLTDAAPADELPPPQGASALAAAAQRVLTPRETEVLRLLASGMDVRAISARLNITVHTARGHVKQVMQKLEARTQLQAVVIALRAGLIRLP
jgi:PAS domain S-box-containing protein